MRHRTTVIRTRLLLSGTALISGVFYLSSSSAFAACTIVPTPGNDTFVCDSGIHAGDVLDLNGDNALTMPAGGTGTIDGNVTFGPGVDTVEIHSGEITGNVQQGDGVDDFIMTGGQIGSLNQGGHFDTFFMSGGRIVDAFDDGDYAEMTGGRIGRVNLKLADNVFIMSGGTIDKNLVAGFGNDTIELSGGTIGGNISVSGGDDSVSVTGGTIGGEVRMSVGNDTFAWDGGGIIYGAIDLGGDDDIASLSNLTEANIGATPQITGGLGTDALTFDNVKTGDVARFDGWETVDLTNDTQLTFDDTLVLGDSGTGTGILTVDSASTIYGGGANGGIAAFTAGQLADVVNSGRIDLTNGGASTSDTFTISGNYTGNGGQIFLDTVLGDDSSASDKLVIDSGAASGTTGMNIINAGGSGALTAQDGIMVVEALNGATTQSGAFALNSRVAAGAYEYYLFKGGVSAGSADNWYLRSTILPNSEVAAAPDPVEPSPPAPEPEEPEVAPPPPPSGLPSAPLPSEGDETTEPADPTPPVDVGDPEPDAPPAPPPAEPADPPAPPPAPPSDPAPIPVDETSTPPTPGATRVVADVVPLYRVEVPTYAVAPPIAHHVALSTLGTFHERRGEQILLHGGGWLPTTWGRVFGQDAEMKWDGTVAPSFDGNLFGFQVGQDVFGRETDNGHFDRVGFFIGHANMDGSVKGQALGWNDLAVGEIDLGGTSFGGYWTHIGPRGWYVDAVLMGTWFSGDASSSSGESIDIDGTGITASLEGGYPFALTDQWTLEPQGQIIWQHLSLDDSADSFSSVSFDTDDTVTGRLGFRLQGSYQTSAGLIQPYVKANLWHNFSSEQTIRFGSDPIATEIDGTSLEFGGGMIAKLSENASVFATADYTTNLGGEKARIFEGNIGLSIKW
ncbi:autotransporter domain-containing protein [Nitratireductor soli]|uniref:autotransporter family protein n=1 Tax=Nitratireductor soli TaxID=1670619 RepID=UPI00065E25D6|nr:autotransporter domain-containing protein [Nitratireductor soli]